MMTPLDLQGRTERIEMLDLQNGVPNGHPNGHQNGIILHGSLETETDDSLDPGTGSDRRPHVVEINIQGRSTRITGPAEIVAKNRKELPAVNGELRHEHVISAKHNNSSNRGYASQRVSNNGFSVKRYIPRFSEPDLTSAHVRETRIVNSASLEGYLNYRIRHTDIPAIYELSTPVIDTNAQLTTSTSVDQALRELNAFKMSDAALGVTNPIFQDDTGVETHGADVKKNGDVVLDLDNVKVNDVNVENVNVNVNEADVNLNVGDNDNVNNVNNVTSVDMDMDKFTDIDKVNADDSGVDVTKSDADTSKVVNGEHGKANGVGSDNRMMLALCNSTNSSKFDNTDEVTINVGSDGTYKPLSTSKKSGLGTSGKYKIEEIFAKAENKPDDKPRDEDTKWLEWTEKKFKEIAGADGQIDLDEFKKALGVKKSFFAERFFELFDQDHSGAIELGELMDGLRMLTKGTPAQKLQFLFDVYDSDGSGSIDRDELKEVLKACMEESSLSLTEENIDDLTDVLFDAADEDESGEITFDELRKELEKHPGVIENLTISAAQWLKPPGGTGGKKNHRYLTGEYLRNNIRKVAYFGIYVIVNIVLFIIAVYQYRDSNEWIQVARGCGLCLNFNGMWVLVLMLRKCLTFLRMTKLNNVLPLDQHIMFHKLCGLVIAAFSLVHTLAHIGNAAVIGNGAMEMWEVLFTTKAGVGFVEASAFITGWLLNLVLVIIVICSLPFVRRGGHFQVFYWTHMLYVVFWILLLLHGPHFWKWFIVPGVLFLLEKLFRSKLIKMARYGDTFITEVNLLPSKVTHLVITRPLSFKYQPGDYIFIQIPAIAKQEWHPFTISSAPEMEGSLWLHVRSAGHWTNKLYEYFDKLEVKEEDPSSGNGPRRKSTTKKFEKFERAYSRRTAMSRRTNTSKNGAVKPKLKHKPVKVKCYIDGPYGTGTREVFNVQHAVLVGAGIGVTPMASILQSVWYKFNETRTTCPKCEHVWYNEEETEDMKLKKVDFIWINRDQKSFEWFLTLLNQLEVEQSSHHGALENCIQTHLYMTAAQKITDMKGIGLQIALDLIYEKRQVDLITGLKTKTNPGRPDWNQIFNAIKQENKGKVKVFFCGAPLLGQQIKEAAEKFNFNFSKENF